ncbi:MAG: response regulator transcription factor [Acidobacteriaceae bacterium]|jgi:DNA-binding NarL/FixJ family response regulator
MINVALADNQEVFLAGLARTLSLQEDIRVIARTTTNEDLRKFVKLRRNTIIIFASALRPDLPSLARDAMISGCRLIVVSENTESLNIYPKLGIQGAVFRDISCDLLLTCVYRVNVGETFLHEVPGRTLNDETFFVGERAAKRLTPQDIRVVSLILEGYSNKEIGRVLANSVQVIKNRLRCIYDKIGVGTRLELAVFAIHHREFAEMVARVSSQEPFINKFGSRQKTGGIFVVRRG